MIRLGAIDQPVRDQCERVRDAMWTEENVERLITLYKEHPALWDPRNKDIKNRARKDEDLKKIGAIMNLEAVEVERKINVLNTQFRRTHKKVQRLKASGLPSDEIEANLWYGYKNLLFLENRYYPKRTNSFIQLIPESQIRSNIGEDSLIPKNLNHILFYSKQIPETEPKTAIEEFESSSDEGIASNGIKVEYPDVSQNNKRLRVEEDPPEKEMTTTNSSTFNDTILQTSKDECDVYGELLAIKMRKFDDRTRYTLMHEIDNLIYRTRMDCK
ncbi:Myb/SANT-like transcription factor [Oryctes borbonicus]|uniref:Myb/SANT-like transcription factor n=1 Tax=Oryctes borbonicus TaxID=1629725 RepID=A0A0T6BE37_9SCAR|nr:Myb/SANT-like transcription factor [Oryctes borbonicus]